MLKRWSPLILLFACCPIQGAEKQDDPGLQGAWLPSSAEFAGQPWPEELRKSTRLLIKDDTYTVTVGKSPDKGTLKLDPTATLKTLDVTGTEGPNQGKTFLAIYEQPDPDTLRICYDLSPESHRPTEFKSTPNSTLFLVTYKREKP
jgi:uncharacterized protein (TIGR03067 family)